MSLWDRERLAEDSGVPLSEGYGGVTLAHNVDSPAAVDRVVAEAAGAGATVTREPAETFWGGYSGVFLDPDGHPWEVAHNPHWTLREDVVLSRRSAPVLRPGGADSAPAGRETTTGRPKAARNEINRRRPTLPGPCEPSTIGAEGLNFSVRNGKRCFPLAKATGKR